MDLPVKGPLVILFITFACFSLTRCELTGVSIRGDEDDVVFMKQTDNDTCGGVLHIENNNTFEVTVNIHDEYSSQDLTVPAEDITDVQLNSSFIQEFNVLGITVSSENETFFKNISIFSHEILDGLHVQYKAETQVGDTSVFDAYVTSGNGITFSLDVSMVDNDLNNAIVIQDELISDKMAKFVIHFPHEGRYDFELNVISKCGEIISKTFQILAFPIVMNVTNYICPGNLNQTFLNKTNILMDSSDPYELICVKDFEDDQDKITEINIDLTALNNRGFLFVKKRTEVINNLTATVYCQNSNDIPTVIVFVLTCAESFSSVNVNREISGYTESEKTILVLHNISNTCMRVIQFQNNYPAEVEIIISEETSKYFIIEPKSSLNLKLDNPEINGITNLTLILKTSKESHTAFLNLKYEDFIINYSTVVLVNEVLNITAEVISGDEVNFSFKILSPNYNEITVAYLNQSEPSKSPQSWALFIAHIEHNFTIQVEGRFSCGEILTKEIDVSVVYPDLCPTNGSSRSYSILNTSSKSMPGCVKDWKVDQPKVIEINIDLVSDNSAMFFIKNQTEVLLSSNAHCQNPTDFPIVVLFVLACTETFISENQDDKIYNKFEKTIFVLHNTSNTCERVISFQNNYLAEVLVNISDITSQIFFIEPKSSLNIKLDNPVMYGFTNFTFIPKSSRKSHATYLSLKYEAMQNLTVNFKKNVFVGDILNISAFVISGSEVNFYFKILSPDCNESSVAHLNKSEQSNDQHSWALFRALLKFNFTIQIQAISACGQILTKEIDISAVYPDLCTSNDTSRSYTMMNSSHKSMPSCIMDLSEKKGVVTQIHVDLTSEDISGYRILTNYSGDIFNKVSESVMCQNSKNGDKFLLFNILLSCLQESFDGLASEGESGPTIHILKTTSNLCGNIFYITNNYSDTQLKITNGSTFETKNFLPETFGTNPIIDSMHLSFDLTYHDTIYSKNITLKFHEVMINLQLKHENRVLVGVPCFITASIASGDIISFDFQVLSPNFNMRLSNYSFEITQVDNKIALLNFTTDFVGKYFVTVTAKSFCKENLTTTINFDAELCLNILSPSAWNNINLKDSTSTFPTCIKTWSGIETFLTEINIDLTSDVSDGFIFLKDDSMDVMINRTSNLTFEDNSITFMIVLTCWQNTEYLEYESLVNIYNKTVYMLFNNSHTFSNIIYVKNNYTVDVIMEISNGTSYQKILIPSDDVNSVNLGNSVFDKEVIQFSFKVNTSNENLTKHLSLVYKETLSGLNVEYSDTVVIGQEYNITASVFSGSDVNIDFQILSPADNKALSRSEASDNGRNVHILFSPGIETNYTVFIEANSFCDLNLTRTITISAVFPEMCPGNLSETFLNKTDFMLDSSGPYKPTCVKDWDNDPNKITEIYLDLTSNNNRGFFFVKNITLTEAIKNITSGTDCKDTPTVILFVLDCTETFSTEKQNRYKNTKFEKTIFVLHKISNTCERVLIFQNNYLAEVWLSISEVPSQDFIIEPKSSQIIKLNNPVIYGFTNFTFKLSTSKESHATFFNLKYEILKDLIVNYKTKVLVGEILNITVLVTSGNEVNFTFKIISPDFNQTSAAYLNRSEDSNNLHSWALFKALIEFNFTLQVEAKSACGENLTKVIDISSVYPDLCPANETSRSHSISDTIRKSLPTCIMDLSNKKKSVTQIQIDLTSEEETSYTIITNYSGDIFNNITKPLLCQNSKLEEIFLLFNIILSCPQKFFDGLASAGDFGQTIYILQTTSNICGNLFYITNNYSDTQIKILNGSTFETKNVLPKSFETNIIKDAIHFTFDLTYHGKFYSKSITLKFYEVLTNLQLVHQDRVLVGVPCYITASVATGDFIHFDFQVISPNKNMTMSNDSLWITHTEDKIANLNLTTDFVGKYFVTVTAESFCKETLTTTVDFDAWLCFYSISTSSVNNLDLTNFTLTSPKCIMTWGDSRNSITEINIDLQINGAVGYIYQINSSADLLTNNKTSSGCLKTDVPVVFSIILSCYTGLDINSTWINTTVYIKRELNYPCEELAVIYNDYTVGVILYYTTLTFSKKLEILPKSVEKITLDSSFSTNQTDFSFVMPSAKEPFIKNLTLIHFDVLYGLSVSHKSEVLIGSICNISASVRQGVNVKFTLLISTPVNSTHKTKINYTVDYITDKQVTLSFTPWDEGIFNIKVIATSMCGEVLVSTINIFAMYAVQDSNIDNNFEITMHRKDPGVFYPKDIIGIALKVNSSVLKEDRPTLPNCTLNWGDGQGAVIEVNVDLTPNQSTSYIYNRIYSYTSQGQYNASVECHNAISRVAGSIVFTIVSPVDHADVVLLKSLVPFNAATSEGLGTVQLIQNYIHTDYPDFRIFLDFGVPGSNISTTFNIRHTSYTYPYLKGNYSIRAVIDSFRSNKTYTFFIRVGYFLRFEQERLRQLIRINEPTTFKLVRYSPNETLNVTFLMDDNKPHNDIFDIGQNIMNITVNYTDEADRKAQAVIVVDGITEIEIYPFETLIPCISTLDFFDDTYRDSSTPLQAWLTTLPTISGRAEKTVACNFTEILTMEWRVRKNENISLENSWLDVEFKQPKAVVLNFDFIKSIGLYKIELQISVNRKNETELDTMYLNVTYPPISVKIKYGAFKQVQFGRSIILDAKSDTKDLADTQKKDVTFIFKCTCYKLRSIDEVQKYTQSVNGNVSFANLTRCNISLDFSSGLINIPTSNFSLNDTLLFHVTAYNADRSGTGLQVVEICDQVAFDVTIECILNCMEKLITDERTVFEAKIVGSLTKDIKSAQYKWTVSKYTTNGLHEVLLNSAIKTDTDIFDAEGGLWEEGVTYSVVVELIQEGYNSSKAVRVVTTNLKPYGGNCSVEPLDGFATETPFIFKFTDWKDEGIHMVRNISEDTNFGLQYEVHQETSSGRQLIYAGNEISATVFLTECKSEGNDDCQVTVYIIDMFRAKISCNLTLKVKKRVQDQFHIPSSTFYSTLDKLLNSSKMMGDSMKIAQRAAALSALITSPNPVDNNTNLAGLSTTVSTIDSGKDEIKDRTNIYVEVVSSEAQKNNGNPGQIQILANSMAIVTSKTHLMSITSMETASSAIKSLTNSLTNVQVELSSLTPCLEGVQNVVDNIIKAQIADSKQLYSNLDNVNGVYTDSEAQLLLENKEKALKEQEHVKLLQYSNIVQNVTKAWDNFFQSVTKMTNSDGKYKTEKENFQMTLQKATVEDVLNQTESSPPLGFTFEGTNVENMNLFQEIHIKVVKTKNIYTHGFNARHINTDIVIGSVQQENGNKLNLTSPKIIHESDKTNISDENLVIFHPTFIEEDASQMFYHKFEYKETFLHFCLKIRPSNPFLSYLLFLRMDFEPTDLLYDQRHEMKRDYFKEGEGICFEPGTFEKSGTVYIGLKPFLDSNQTANPVNTRKKREAINNNLEASYHFGITSAACFSWDHTVNDWTINKCRLTNLTGAATCSCEHGMEVISGMSFNLFPNTIHFATVFSKFDIKGQGLVIGVLLGLYLLFTLIAFWAHYMDRKAMFQWGVFPLVDNYAYDTYFYLITIHTGLRKSAGTTSNVSFTLSGELDDSGIRKLSDGIKKSFPTGSVYHFVMACPAALGDLQCLRIWHDSSGSGSNATWYLDRIDVVDLQTGKVFYFICDEWLAPEYGIDKMIEASNIEDLEKLKNLFFSNTKEHITDDHMWVSLFIRPEKSNFSRVERAICCLTFLLLSMITSAMFYKDVPGIDRKQAKADFEMGFIRISFEQLYHSLVSAAITAVPMVFVMMVFRKARTSQNGGCCLCQKKNIIEAKQQFSDIQDIRMVPVKKKSFILPWMAKLENQLEALEKIILLKSSAYNLQGSWPHQLRYFAWFIMMLAIIASSFFVLLYSMEWGKDVTETWMSTFLLTFFQSLFIVDPIKVIAISVIISLLLRKAKVKNVDYLDLELIAQVNKQYGVKEKYSQLDMSYAPPLTKTELRAATLKRKIHILINSLIKEFIIHFVYLLIVATLCHANRSPRDYQMHNVIYGQLLDDPKTGFLHLNSTSAFIKWIPRNLTPWLFPDDKFYTYEKELYRLGTPRLRQLRMKKEPCSLQKVRLKECVFGYSFSEEETSNYCPGWQYACSSKEQSDFANAWKYQKSQDIWGLPIAGEYSLYNGGGYIAVLRFKNTVSQIIEDLNHNMWIDRQTRAVIIEFTLYCPSSNHFVFIVLIAEFLETGGIVPYFSIYPFTVHYPPGIMGTFVQLCQIVGTIFIFIGCMYVVFIFGMKKCSAFKDFWFLLDLTAVLTAISAASMMFLRLKFTNLILSKIKEDRAQFVNMYHVVVWDSAYTICLAILITIGCFRLLKLASYSESTMKVYKVLSKAIAILPTFSVFILLILLSFIFFGWISFGKTSTYFKSFWSTTETMFTGILGRSSFKDTNSPIEDRWINIVFFCLFVWVVVVFLINFFLAVLVDLMKKMEGNVSATNTKVFIVIWDMLMRIIGSKRNPLDRLKDIECEDEQSESDDEEIDDSPHKTLLLLEKKLVELYKNDDKELIKLIISKFQDSEQQITSK